MGMYSDFSGEVNFSRPLTKDEWAQLKVAPTDRYSDYEVSPYGVTIEGNSKSYGWVRDLRDYVNALPSDMTASGYIERSGTEGEVDLERAYVLGRKVTTVKPQIIWTEPTA